MEEDVGKVIVIGESMCVVGYGDKDWKEDGRRKMRVYVQEYGCLRYRGVVRNGNRECHVL